MTDDKREDEDTHADGGDGQHENEHENEGGVVDEQLRAACATGDLAAARALLEAGAPVDARDEKGRSALYLAAKGGDVRVMELLLEHGADLHAVTKRKKSVLHAAAAYCGVAAVQFLLERGHPTDVRDETRQTVLVGAATRINVETMRVLVDAGVDIHAVDWNQETALHRSARAGHLEASKFLVSRGAAVNAVDVQGETALHYAMREGHAEVVAFLLEQGADVEAEDGDDWTALHCAASNGHGDIVRMLLEHGATVDAKSKQGTSAFSIAAENVFFDVMRVLAEYGADTSVVFEDGRTALHCSAEAGHVEAVSFLLAQGLSVGAVTSDGASVLHYAAAGGEVGIVTRLVELGADVHSVQRDGKTVLHSAAKSGSADVVELLLDRGLEANAVDRTGTSVIHNAAMSGEISTVNLLIDRGADTRAITKNGQTALHYAARSSSVDAVSLLLDKGLFVNAECKNGLSPLHYAALEGDISIMKALLDRGAEPDAITKDGRSALHCAARNGHARALEFLLEQGLSADVVAVEGGSVFQHAVDSEKFEVMKVMIDRGAEIQTTLRNGRTALHYAAEYGTVEMALKLLKQGLSVNALDEDDTSALLLAVSNDDIAMMEALIRHGADLHTIHKDQKSPLHYAALYGNAEIVSYLLKNGVPVDLREEGGATGLHYAAAGGDIGIMKLFLDGGANPFATTNNQETALHCAVNQARTEALEFVLQLGLKIDDVNIDGFSALHVAARDGYIDLIRFLIDRGADVWARTKDGRSALHIATEYGSVQEVEFLIEQGIKIDETDEDGKTPLHVAALTGRDRMMKFLISQGADAQAVTKMHQNLVHLATEAGDIDALNLALKLGVDPNARVKTSNVWVSPLLIALRGDDCENVCALALALCSAGAHFDEKDGQSALAFSEIEKTSTGKESAPSTLSEPPLWRSGICSCIGQWAQEYQAGTSKYTKVPMEVIKRGEASVRTYLADVARSSDEDRLHRCKICVVGPSEWGKTSLVQSLKADTTMLTQLKDRTVGIDLTTCQLTSVVDDSTVRLEITFWDFAGQDVYHAAHTLFFSQRTLFVLVVDLEAYWKELEDAESKSDRVAQAQMNRFVGAKIFRWVRSIFAHRPDAQFVVVGSKVDRLEDSHVVAEIWEDLRDRIDHWKTAFAEGLDSDLLRTRASVSDMKARQERLSLFASSEWLVTNIMAVDSIRAFRTAIQSTITSSDLGFPMWKTYTQVLQSVVRRREEAHQSSSARERMEKSITRFKSLRRKLVGEKIEGLERDACEQIVRTLSDLGDVLWYEHDGAGVFKDCVILDPKLVIEVVREVIRHDFSSDTDGKPPRDGRITHSQLSTFPLWKDMDVELMHAFKALLQHFQLAYPADADTMLPESDIIVPAYWNADESASATSKPKPKLSAPQKSLCDAFSVHRYCWEYEVPSELSETVFVQFAVQSHSSYLTRSIRGFCVEAGCAEFATSISLIQRDAPRDVLRIEVSGVSAELSWDNMRFYLMKMEKVLEGYHGDVVLKYIVHRTPGNSSESRHPVGHLLKAVQDAIAMGKGKDAVREKMPWMPPDMDWFLHKSWNDITSLQQLRMNHLIEEKLEALQKLAIAGNAPRQFPALWSLEYDPVARSALLRMSSDLSGQCFHIPLKIDTGSALLARHALMFKAGVSLFATVVGNAVSLPIVQNVLDAAKSAFDNNADHAERVHNLIDKLDLSSERFDTRTTSKLSPGASMVLLRDLLKAYDDSLDALVISEISNLECAVTVKGEYVWAHAHEIAAMGDKLTRCAAPPAAWKGWKSSEAASSGASVSSAASAPPTVGSLPQSPGSSSAVKSSSKNDFKFSVCVDSVTGLSDWDWHKTYCKWQLYYGKSLTPLASDTTPTNGDSSCAPSWRSMRATIESVTSVEMLRKCRVTVQVKRRSRIGWTKLIGEGEVLLRDFVDDDAAQNFSCEPVVVPLGTTTDRAVVLTLALEK